MDIDGVRFEIEDNINSPSGEGRKVAELVEFLQSLPQDATLVWDCDRRGNYPLLFVNPGNSDQVYICRSTVDHGSKEW